MLTDIDDLVRDTVRSVLIHEQLLFIECCQNVQQIVYRLIKLCTFVPYETNDVAEIPFDIPKLLSDAFANGFLGSLLALGKIQIVPPGLLATSARHSPSMFLADFPDCLFQKFSRMVQQLKILWKSDIRWATGCIHDERSLVLCFPVPLAFFGFLRLFLIRWWFSAARIFVIVIRFILGDTSFQYRCYRFWRESLSELHHG